MIPELMDGVLPEGIHDCTLQEVIDRFGQFHHSDRRPRLADKLKKYVEDTRQSGVAVAIVIDGSYVTAKTGPSDIDLILVLKSDLDLKRQLRPMEYNAQSKRMVRRLYGFDVLPAVDGSETYLKYVEFFSHVRLDDPELKTTQSRKGLLRIDL